MFTEIDYVDSICAAGKTYFATRYALKKASLGIKNVCIVQPTRELLEQTYADLTTLNIAAVRVEKIYRTDDDGPAVSKKITDVLKNIGPKRIILLITHAAFLQLGFWPAARTWEIIHDEIPTINPSSQLSFEANSDRLTSLCEVTDIPGDYYRLLLKKRTGRKLAAQCVRLNNSVLNVYRELSQMLLNRHTDVYCLKAKWHKVVDGAIADEGSRKKDKQIDFYGFVRPSLFEGFSKVTIMGAHFCVSLLHNIWSNDGIVFRRSSDIIPRSEKHSLGSRKLRIHYLSKRDWSKNHRNSLGFNNGRIPANIVSAIEEKIGNQPYIWVANKDIANNALSFGSGCLISNISHGLNTHQRKNAAVCLSALNLKPDHQNIFRQMFGISSDDLRIAGFYQSQYQAIFRCSLRDKASTADVTLVVTDIHFAEWFAGLFEEQENISISELIPDLTAAQPPRVSLTNKERQTRKNDKYKEMVLAAQQVRKQKLICAEGGVMTPNTIVVSTQCQKTPRPVQMSIIRNIFAEPESICFDSVEQLIEQLSACSKDTIADKKFNILISPATFVSTTETKRGRANVSLCDGIWLDQDGGALTPQTMQAKFPGLRFIAMNTFSGYTRYFIPTSKPVTADEYERIWDYLIRTIDMPDSGIDVSKRPACSIFYLPSQAKDPSKNFWFEQQGEYLNCDTIPAAPVLPVFESIRPVIQHSTKSILDYVLSIINGTGAGRHNRDYTRIVGFIQHNRQSFSDSDLQNILNAWRQVDSTKSRSKDFWKAVNKLPKRAGSQLALAA